MRDLKAVNLLKANIDALLKARSQKRKDLAVWCRRSEGWLSQIFTNEGRNVPLKYLDRIADFFGIATYQLFQPGIGIGTERRSGSDRRQSGERRISALSLAEQPRTAVDLMDLIRAISPDGRKRAIPILADILNDELRAIRRPPATATSRGGSHHTAETDAAVPAPARGRKR